MKIREYIEKYGKIQIVDKHNNFTFFCNGKNMIGGSFKKSEKRML